MKECFVEKEFNETATALIKASNAVLDQYRKQGYDLSLRQLFYQLVAHNIIPNKVEWYTKLGGIINDARLAGLVDWNMITDRGRLAVQAQQWSTPGQALKETASSFMLNKWNDQSAYIEVMVEKQALQGVLQPVCLQLGIAFTANKGYSSASSFYQCSRRILNAISKGKKPLVLYLGDHDPSGVDMTRDLRDRLSMFCRQSVEVQRVALNMPQIETHRCPPNPAKLTDSRATSYIEQFGRESWELDALPPAILAQLVKSAVAKRVDRKKWEAALVAEKQMKNAIAKIAEVFDTPKAPEL